MANLKEVRIRIASVSSTQQITKAMKLVSATKLRKAQNAITQMRPYADKLHSLLMNLSDSIDNDALSVYFSPRDVKKVLIIVVASDRGLCGAFNANAAKETRRIANEKYPEQLAQGNVDILCIGKKGYDFLKTKLNANYNRDHMGLFQDLNAENGFQVAESILSAFRNGEYDAVDLVYNQFKNAATQILKGDRFLPIDLDSFTQEDGSTEKKDYIFEPSKDEILEELIPQILKTQIYRAVLDSHASEHGARMVAMDKATDNAGELLKELKLQYNQARQAAITNEISEIVGGAAALSQG